MGRAHERNAEQRGENGTIACIAVCSGQQDGLLAEQPAGSVGDEDQGSRGAIGRPPVVHESFEEALGIVDHLEFGLGGIGIGGGTVAVRQDASPLESVGEKQLGPAK